MVHDKRDNVGVGVGEGLTADTAMLCVVTQTIYHSGRRRRQNASR